MPVKVKEHKVYTSYPWLLCYILCGVKQFCVSVIRYIWCGLTWW